jgi:hypothetical protein
LYTQKSPSLPETPNKPLNEQEQNESPWALQDDFTMHFAATNQEEMGVNAGLFDAIEEILAARTQFAHENKLREFRGLLQRPLEKPQRPTQEMPIIITKANFPVRQLVVTIPDHLWASPMLDFPCPNSHCDRDRDRDATIEHLQEHRGQFSDGAWSRNA